MQRIDSRTVQFTADEADLIEEAREDWDETTDPVTFILNLAVVYGVVVQDDFVNYLAEDLRGGSALGWAVGSPYAGSTITHVTDEGSVHLADGRRIRPDAA